MAVDALFVTKTAALPRGAHKANDHDSLVRSGLPLVQHVVSEIVARVPRSVPRDDLVSAGMLGLTQAARGWDSSRGVSFEGYARIRINGAVLDELRDRDWASRSVRAEARRVQEATEELTATLGRAPSSREIAEHLGVRVDVIDRLSDDLARATVLSYEEVCADPHSPGAGTSVDDCPAEALVARERRSVLGDAVASLPARLRKVVIDYFFEERPMLEIAEELGVTESRISQMRGEALALMRSGMTANLDPDQLPAEPRPTGRLARKKAAYYAAVAAGSTVAARLDATPTPIHQRLAASA